MACFRSVSVGTLLVFASTTLLSPLAEANLWQDRRAARDRAAAPLQLASAAPLGAQISGQMPMAAPLVRNAGIATPAPSRGSGALGAVIAALPQNAVSIREVKDAGPSAPVIVVLQDVHLNVEAQGNLSSTLERLIAQGGVRRVGVEGAFAPFDLRRLDFPDAALTRRVADDFLAAKKLAAPSHAAMTLRNSGVSFLGVDDRAVYDQNVAAYLGASARLAATRAQVASLKAALEGVKARVYGPAMTRLDRMFAAQRSGALPFGAYLKELAAAAGDPGPAVSRFLEAYALETSLDFTRVDRERRRAVEKLTAALSETDLRSLLNETVAFRAGQIGVPAFHQHLRDLCAAHGVRMSAYPAFAAYIRYIVLADGISTEDLAAEQEAMENRAVRAAAQSDDERAAADADRRLTLVSRLVDFALAPREWQRLDENPSALAALPADIARLARGSAAPLDLNDFLTFYRCAGRRSQTIVSRLLDGNAGPAALVVGGFHTPRLLSLLAQRGCSVVVCAPKLTRVDGSGTEYLTIFGQQKTPLEKLFSGERLTLAPATVNLTDPATMNQVVTETAARAVEQGETALPDGVTARQEGDLIRVDTGSGETGTVETFVGRTTTEEKGFEEVGPRVGVPGADFRRKDDGAPAAVRETQAAIDRLRNGDVGARRDALTELDRALASADAAGRRTILSAIVSFALADALRLKNTEDSVARDAEPVVIGALDRLSPEELVALIREIEAQLADVHRKLLAAPSVGGSEPGENIVLLENAQVIGARLVGRMLPRSGLTVNDLSEDVRGLMEIDFRDGGGMHHLMSHVTDGALTSIGSPDVRPVAGQPDFSRPLPEEAIGLRALLSRAGLGQPVFEKRLGRTLIFREANGQKRVALKLGKTDATSRDARALSREARFFHWLNSPSATASDRTVAKEMELESEIPRVAGDAQTLYRLLPSEFLTEGGGAALADAMKSFPVQTGNDGRLLAMAYVVNNDDYFRYASQDDLSEHDFDEGLFRGIRDLFRLARHGIFHTSLVDIFHTNEAGGNRQSQDAGRYLLLVDLIRGINSPWNNHPEKLSLMGPGRLRAFLDAIRYSNIRVSGVADFGDVATLDEIAAPTSPFSASFRDIDARHYTPDKTRAVFAMNFLSEYLLAAVLIMGSRGRAQETPGERLFFDKRSWKNDATVAQLAQKMHFLFTEAYAAYLGAEAREDMMARVGSDASFRDLARQMLFFMTDAHVRYARPQAGAEERGVLRSLFPGARVNGWDYRWKTFNDQVGFTDDPASLPPDQQNKPSLGSVNGPLAVDPTLIEMTALEALKDAKPVADATNPINARNALGALGVVALLALGLAGIGLSADLARPLLVAALALPSFFGALAVIVFAFRKVSFWIAAPAEAGPPLALFGRPAVAGNVDFVEYDSGRFIVNPLLYSFLTSRFIAVRFLTHLGLGLFGVALHERTHAAGKRSETLAFAGQALPLVAALSAILFLPMSVVAPSALLIAAIPAYRAARTPIIATLDDALAQFGKDVARARTDEEMDTALDAFDAYARRAQANVAGAVGALDRINSGLLARGFAARWNGLMSGDRLFILERVTRRETVPTDEGPVTVFHVSNVTAGGLAFPWAGLSPLGADYVLISNDGMATLAAGLRADVEKESLPDLVLAARSGDLSARSKLMTLQFRRKGIEGLTPDQSSLDQERETVVHEVEHERRRRKLADSQRQVAHHGIEEEMADLRSMADTNPFLVLAGVIAATSQPAVSASGNPAEWSWAILIRLAGLDDATAAREIARLRRGEMPDPALQQEIFNRIGALLPLSKAELRARAAAAYQSAERDWLDAHRGHLRSDGQSGPTTPSSNRRPPFSGIAKTLLPYALGIGGFLGAATASPVSLGLAGPVVIGVFGGVFLLNVALLAIRVIRAGPGQRQSVAEVYRRLVLVPLTENGIIVISSTALYWALYALGLPVSPLALLIGSFVAVGIVFTAFHVVANYRATGKLELRPVLALSALYVAFSVVFLQYPLLSFLLVFKMHGPAWNLFQMNLKAVFGIDSQWLPLASVEDMNRGANNVAPAAPGPGRRLLETFLTRPGRQETPEQFASRRYESMIRILNEFQAPRINLGQTTQVAPPAFDRAAFASELRDEMRLALTEGRMNRADVAAASDVFAALLSSDGRAAAGAGLSEDDPALMDYVPAADEKGRLSLTAVRWLKPGASTADALKIARAWQSGRRGLDDRLGLMAPAEDVARAQAAIDAAGIVGVRVLDMSAHPDAVSVLKELVGNLDEGTLAQRKFRFLLRSDVRVDGAFFDVADRLPAASAKAFRDAVEVYMIVGEIMKAVPIGPDMLKTFETLRTVMIQA